LAALGAIHGAFLVRLAEEKNHLLINR
jgi:hypothetical protein